MTAGECVADNLRHEVLSVLQERFGIDPTTVSDGTRFREELDLDSIDFFDMTGVIEKRYGVDLNFADFVAVSTFGEFMDTLARFVHGRQQ